MCSIVTLDLLKHWTASEKVLIFKLMPVDDNENDLFFPMSLLRGPIEDISGALWREDYKCKEMKYFQMLGGGGQGQCTQGSAILMGNIRQDGSSLGDIPDPQIF